MKGGTVALIIALPLVLGGGGVGAYFLLRRKPAQFAQAYPGQAMATAQAAFGSKAVAEMGPPGAGAPAQAGTAKIYGQGTLADPRIMAAAGNIVDKFYPGMGSAAAGVVSKIDATVGTGLFKKIPGIGSLGGKLKLW